MKTSYYVFKPPIKDHVDIDCCWVCGVDFIPPSDVIEHKPPAKKHLHHVVPRAYGGTNGPMISICTNCHNIVHECGDKLYAGNPTNPFQTKTAIERCLYLATVICNSRRLHEKDANKKVVFSCSFDADTHSKLKDLVKYFKPNSSQPKIIVKAIHEMHRKYLGSNDTPKSTVQRAVNR